MREDHAVRVKIFASRYWSRDHGRARTGGNPV